jgi:hypothetical protein
MKDNTVALAPEILEQLEWWKQDKAAETAAKASRQAREDWIISQLGEVPMAGMSRELHTEAQVNILFKQSRAFLQPAVAGVAARYPHLVNTLLNPEYKVDNRQLTSLIAEGQDPKLKAELLACFTLKAARPSFKEEV